MHPSQQGSFLSDDQNKKWQPYVLINNAQYHPANFGQGNVHCYTLLHSYRLLCRYRLLQIYRLLHIYRLPHSYRLQRSSVKMNSFNSKVICKNSSVTIWQILFNITILGKNNYGKYLVTYHGLKLQKRFQKYPCLSR